MTTPVWIGLGSNLGDRKGTLDAAIAALAEAPGVTVGAVSSYHETTPVGGPPGQGAFLNAAARLETTLGPFELLAVTQAIEDRLGRVRAVRWGARTLDLDILIYGAKFLDTKDLKLPHPRLALRRFVLAPLAEIAPNIVDTMTKRTVADLLANLDRRPRLLALEGPKGQRKSTVFRRLVEELAGFGIGVDEVISGADRHREEDPDFRRFDHVERKAEAILAEHWATQTPRPSWLITDYCLGFDLSRSVASIRAFLARDSRDRPAIDAFYRRIRRIQDRERHALRPTLAVQLPETECVRGPGRANFPQLWPDSDEPDAIIAEVVATCRSIAGV